MTNIIKANDDNIREIVEQEIQQLGTDADLNHIDVSEVTNMMSLFWGSEFNGDISKWDVSNVTDMSSMFEDSTFNGDISNWDVSSVENMSGMFFRSIFNGDISLWDVSRVRDMSSMFAESEFAGDLSKWNINAETKTLFMMGMEAYNPDNWQDGDIPGCVGIVAYMVEEKDEDRPFKLVRVDSED